MRKLILAAALAAASFSSPALANGDSGYASSGFSEGDLLVRLRGIAVVPQDDGDLNGGAVEHTIDTSIVPEIDFTYFITDNIAAELILATAPHELSARGAVNAKIGEVWLLPPTLTLQYHFTDLGAFKPYIGAGVNYTIFYNKDETLQFDVDNAFGFALQAGVDYDLQNGYYLNVDVKHIFLQPDISVANGAVTGDAGINPWVIGAGVGYKF